MKEQKKLNTFPVNAIVSKNISTVAGVMIILIVAVLVGAGIFYLLQIDSLANYYDNPIVSSKYSKSKTVDKKEAETISQAQIKKNTIQLNTKEVFDFGSELKELDNQNNSINPDDFNENEMSDVNVGL